MQCLCCCGDTDVLISALCLNARAFSHCKTSEVTRFRMKSNLHQLFFNVPEGNLQPLRALIVNINDLLDPTES